MNKQKKRLKNGLLLSLGLSLELGMSLVGLSGCQGTAAGQAAPSRLGDVIGNSGPKSDTPVTPTPSATPPPNAADLYTGPEEVGSYVVKFVEDAQAQGRNVLDDMKNPNLEIQIASLGNYGSSVIGLCESSGNMRRVTLAPEFWNSASETQKELLVHHELGHCVLYRPHNSSTLSSGDYASIMYPIIMSSSMYMNNYDYYQKELFSQALMAGRVDPNASVTHICNLSDLMTAE